jgi:cell division septation protein DedD
MADEGLHEIQLNGKQLVFLFMAATVVSVVIFLCGVMVGRGVRAQRAELSEAAAATGSDPTIPADTSRPVTAGASTSTNTPVAPQETLTYPSRLEGQEPPEETLKEPVPAPVAAAPLAAASGPRREPPVRVASSLAVPGEPAGNGFVVQVAAVNDRRNAETIARRLAGKGYPSFITAPGTGTPRMFRVRVGKYEDRREAESIAGRLEREEQFKPWITR